MANNWPAFWYGPNGEAVIFHTASDVPQGWRDEPFPPAPPPPPTTPEKKRSDTTLTRQQIVDGLKERGVVFQRNAATAVLYDLLVAEVERTGA